MKKIKKIFISILLVITLLQSFPLQVMAQVATQSGSFNTSAFQNSYDESEFDMLMSDLLISSSINSLTNTGQQATTLIKKFKHNVRSLSKKSYRSTEKVPVIIDNEDPNKVKLAVFNSDGEEVQVTVENESVATTTVLMITPPSHFKPGRYRIQITDSQGQVTNQDFTWGVLAINTNKSIYLPNDTARISMAVLDETGNMVCDAKVTLSIKDPQGQVLSHSTEENSIRVNPICYLKEFSLEPDFEARYSVSTVGKYEMTLTGITKNGTYTITDAFEVAQSVPFDVERTSATRLFPPLKYPMIFDITAEKDFKGEISEVVPESFKVSNIDGLLPFDAVATHSAEPVTDSNSISLSYPFEGNFVKTQGFGVDETDSAMAAKYVKYGLVGHDGLDFALPQGTPVISVDTGIVVKASENGDYGTTIIVQHSWGRSYYGHLSQMDKEVGTSVAIGEQIGLSGNTGLLTTGPHLHFGVKLNENNPGNGYYGKINPLPYMTTQMTEVLGVATPSAILRPDDAMGVQIITWKVDLKKGDKIKIGYNFLSPPKSPQFYTLGPLAFTASDEDGFPEFVESRKWQIAVDADGSGTMVVSATDGVISEGSRIYNFTYTTGESVATGSGAITIQEPTSDDWTTPQTSNAAAAGYLTVDPASTGVVGDVINVNDAIGSWVLGTSCTTSIGIVSTAGNVAEGTGSLQCVTGNEANNDQFRTNTTSANWSAYTTLGAWVKTTVATTGLQFIYDDTTNCASVLETITTHSPGTIPANVWTWTTWTFGVTTRTAVICYGFSGTVNSMDSRTTRIDYMIAGPGTPTVSGTAPWTITAPIVSIPATTGNIRLRYGSGDASADVTNSATPGIHTFTTRSKIATNPLNNLVAVSTSPTITLVNTTTPPLERLMRNGKWSYNGGEIPFTF